jgi:hypothetical protein
MTTDLKKINRLEKENWPTWKKNWPTWKRKLTDLKKKLTNLIKKIDRLEKNHQLVTIMTGLKKWRRKFFGCKASYNKINKLTETTKINPRS